MKAAQLSLFEAVSSVYASRSGPVSNEDLYDAVAGSAGVSPAEMNRRVPIGDSGQAHSPLKRAARWVQQTLKCRGLLRRVERGVWEITAEGKKQLHTLRRGYSLVAFSTDLGVALWGRCEDVFGGLEAPIDLILTSPPYPLRKSRRYGNVDQSAYVDFLCKALEPVVAKLADGGSLALNISQDIFVPGSPARSLYKERLILALHDRLGLHKMDELIWHAPNKAPAPVQWASVNRYQLNVGYEPVIWMTNNPAKVKSDNRRVLEPHTERHLRLLAEGGERRERVNSDGAYRIRAGSYGHSTPGRIPRNVLTVPVSCSSQRRYKQAARELGLPVHGAPYPQRLSDFLVQFLTAPGDLVADPFAGSMTTAVSAEELGRRWICTELGGEYARGGAERFRERPGFWLNPELDFLFQSERKAQQGR